jgi:hypothetical protein
MLKSTQYLTVGVEWQVSCLLTVTAFECGVTPDGVVVEEQEG